MTSIWQIYLAIIKPQKLGGRVMDYDEIDCIDRDCADCTEDCIVKW